MEAEAILPAIDERAPAALERFGVPGLAAGVLSRSVAAERCYGLANLDTAEPVHPETRFRVASVTKPVVATLAMRLVQEGRLALDEPLRGLRLPWAGITLRHLLSHQAGLAGDWPKPLDGYGEGDDALELLAADEPLAGPVGPGELFSYCNPAYWLLGTLTSRAAETPFECAMQQLVLDPLGLERTGFTADGPAAVGHLAESGSREHRVAGPLAYPRARRPSGGLLSCPGDLLRFAAHHLGGRGPLQPKTVRLMQAPQVAVEDGGYGLGFGIVAARGRTTIEHGGAVPGFRSLLLLLPGEETAFVFLTNSDRGMLVIEDILDAVGLAQRLPPEASVPNEEVEALTGCYREPCGSEIVVSARAGGLDFVSTDAPRIHLRPAGSGRFVVREGDERGDSAEFFRDRQLLRWAWLYERVQA